MITIDFETLPIEARPDFPPEPVCVSIKHKGRKPVFVHGKGAMQQALLPLFRGKEELLFHNAAFDVAVAVEKLGMPMPAWRRVHDTKFLLFLHDPYQNLSLKPASKALLDIGEEDQQELADWIYANIPEAKGKKGWGKWIGYAPEPLLRKRAHGDTLRTEQLFDLLMPQVLDRKMGDAYNRERRLLPMLLDNSRRGIQVDRSAIIDDREQSEQALLDVDKIIRKVLRAPGLNPGSPQELIVAIEKAGKGGDWLLTPGGKPSANKNSLLQGVKDKKVLALLQYRGKLETALTLYLRPWNKMLASSFDRLYTDWNQVRAEGKGAATGRKSSSPNWQNIPKYLKAEDLSGTHGLPAIPTFKRYFYPDEGETWVRRDFSQQELRILAHMAGGELQQMYLNNPKIDFHQHAADNMKHLDLMRSDVQIKVNRYDDPRGIAKMIAFSILYGMGNSELAYRLGISDAEARTVRASYLTLFPGLKRLQDQLAMRAKANEPFRTWGGREYYCAPPAFVDGRVRSFEYKMLNYLIQGSAADVTKEALCRLWEQSMPGRLMLDVHDEISFSIPGNAEQVKEHAIEMGRLMCGIEMDVPMLSDAEAGPHWGAIEKQPTW